MGQRLRWSDKVVPSQGSCTGSKVGPLSFASLSNYVNQLSLSLSLISASVVCSPRIRWQSGLLQGYLRYHATGNEHVPKRLGLRFLNGARLMKLALAVIALVTSVSAVSAAECVSCHPAQAGLHASSAHAFALMRPAGSLFANRLSGRPLSEGPDGFAFEYNQTATEVTARRGSERATSPLVWIFGSGRQGQTPVLYYRGHFIEHRVSYYAATGFGITIGQVNGASADANRALGRVESNGDARLCFNCHATGVSRDLARMTPGIQCIRCHSGAEEHAEGKGKVLNPGKLNHREQVELCGECHRLKSPSGDDANIGNVRFQPLRLMKSACFQKSEIECTTCHPAHRNAARGVPDTYNSHCVACHADRSSHVAKVGSADCIGCHMPKVSPAPGLTFTDHFIRVVEARGAQ